MLRQTQVRASFLVYSTLCASTCSLVLRKTLLLARFIAFGFKLDFETYKVGAWKYVIPERLQSFLTGDCDDDDESYEPFYNLEQLGGSTGLDYYKFPLPSLHKLKYVSGHSYGDYNEVCL